MGLTLLCQLQLWARMISSGNHESTDDPPKVPAITGVTPKEKGSLADAISNAATTFAQALKPQVSVCAANNSVA